MHPNDESLILALCEAKVDFVLVGAMAGIVRGAPFTTLDVDIVHSRGPANLERLITLLVRIDAHYRGRPKSQKLAPTREHLDTSGHVLLRTALGPLDVLGAIENGADYEWLAQRSELLVVQAHAVRVPTLETLIELKRHGTRPEDPAKLAQLEAVLTLMKGE